MRLVGVVLLLLGVAGFVLGGVSWTREKTVLDAGPLQVKTDQREGVAIPPVAGAVLVVAGLALIAIPRR